MVEEAKCDHVFDTLTYTYAMKKILNSPGDEPQERKYHLYCQKCGMLKKVYDLLCKIEKMKDCTNCLHAGN